MAQSQSLITTNSNSLPTNRMLATSDFNFKMAIEPSQKIEQRLLMCETITVSNLPPPNPDTLHLPSPTKDRHCGKFSFPSLSLSSFRQGTAHFHATSAAEDTPNVDLARPAHLVGPSGSVKRIMLSPSRSLGESVSSSPSASKYQAYFVSPPSHTQAVSPFDHGTPAHTTENLLVTIEMTCEDSDSDD